MARYKLIGTVIQGQEINQRTPSMAEQQQVNENVVYETDDHVEAQTIYEAGGFYRDRDNFIVVSGIVDSTAVVDQPQGDPFFRPATFPQKGN